MNLSELLEYQRKFDAQHRGATEFYEAISDQNPEVLEHLLVCLIGEVGEIANVTKKVVRGDFPLSSKREEVADELADVFAYVLKLANQLEIDLERSYLDKMRRNRLRFSGYEK